MKPTAAHTSAARRAAPAPLAASRERPPENPSCGLMWSTQGLEGHSVGLVQASRRCARLKSALAQQHGCDVGARPHRRLALSSTPTRRWVSGHRRQAVRPSARSLRPTRRSSYGPRQRRLESVGGCTATFSVSRRCEAHRRTRTGTRGRPRGGDQCLSGSRVLGNRHLTGDAVTESHAQPEARGLRATFSGSPAAAVPHADANRRSVACGRSPPAEMLPEVGSNCLDADIAGEIFREALRFARR